MEFKGTPAPWFVGRTILTKGGDSLVVSPVNQHLFEKGYRNICNVSPIVDLDDEDIANATLISKAPDMLDALKQVLHDWGGDYKRNDGHGNSPLYNKVESLIKAATEVEIEIERNNGR